MKITITPTKEGESPEQVITDIESYDLFVSRLVVPENVKVMPGGTVPVQTQIGHASLLGIHDSIRAIVMSFDALKVKSAQAMEQAAELQDQQYKLLYKKLADFALAYQRKMSELDLEMTKIEKQELDKYLAEQKDEPAATPEEPVKK